MAGYKNVAIVGASGSIGKIILEGLVASGKFHITVITRQDSSAAFPPGVRVHKSDFSEEGLEKAFNDTQAVISAVGATAFGEQKKIVDAAARAGVQHFLPSEFSANSKDEAVLQLLPLFSQKKDLLEYLKSKQSGQFSWTGVCTGPLLDWGLLNGFLEFDIAKRTAVIWDEGNKSFTGTNEKQLADAVISVLLHPEQTKNQYLYISSVETTQNELLNAFEKETGSKWTVAKTTSDAQISDGFKKLGEGDFSGAFALVRATTFSNRPGLRANFAKDEILANEVLGLGQESVEGIVKRVVGN